MQSSPRFPRPGEIWITDFGLPHPHEPAGRRPAVVVGPITSRSSSLPFVFLVPITRTQRYSISHIEIPPTEENGLTHTSAAQSELVRSVSRERCIEQIGIIDSERWNAIRESIKNLFRF